MTFFATQLQEPLSTQSLQTISYVYNQKCVFLVKRKEIRKVYKEVNTCLNLYFSNFQVRFQILLFTVNHYQGYLTLWPLHSLL